MFCAVEVMFNQSEYMISEETGLLLFGIKLSQASDVPFEITISFTNETTAGIVV